MEWVGPRGDPTRLIVLVAIALMLALAGCTTQRGDPLEPGTEANDDASGTETSGGGDGGGAGGSAPATAPRPAPVRIHETGGPEAAFTHTIDWTVEPSWRRVLVSFRLDAAADTLFAIEQGEATASKDGETICSEGSGVTLSNSYRVFHLEVQRSATSLARSAQNCSGAGAGAWSFHADYPAMAAEWTFTAEVDY